MEIHSRQSIFDVALQHCGNLESAFGIAELNGLSLTDDLEVGASMTMPEADNKQVVQHYAVNTVEPATAITQDEINAILATGEGIEFWGIEYDFIVQ